MTQGSLTEYAVIDPVVISRFRFDPPVLIPNASLFLGIAGSGNANTKRIRGRIGYTLEKGAAGDFIAALVE